MEVTKPVALGSVWGNHAFAQHYQPYVTAADIERVSLGWTCSVCGATYRMNHQDTVAL